MTDRANQHFVPQFYFRRFSVDGRTVNLLLKRESRIVLDAPMKGQCAKHRFYGPKEIESLFCGFESRHAATIRAALDAIWIEVHSSITRVGIARLLEAIMFQRSRTILEAERFAPAVEGQTLRMFRMHLETAPDIENREKLIRAIDSGDVRIAASRRMIVLQLIRAALESYHLVADLAVCALRNWSTLPFVFGDSPVVMVNTYLRNIKSRGVLGLQTPGLQIFMPLDPFTVIMLYDSRVYSGPWSGSNTIDVHANSDVSQINALQLHNSLHAIYFRDAGSADYVLDLWRAHRPGVLPSPARFEVLRDALVDGKPVDGELLHVFDQQINMRLSLSFLTCEPIEESDYRFSYRCPEAVAEHRRQFPSRRSWWTGDKGESEAD